MNDPPSIETSEEYRQAVQALTRRSRPPWLLRLIMNALEGYRQKRKMGWSRPQNKYGVTTHHAFELDPGQDPHFFSLALPTFLAEFPEADDEEAAFVRDLQSDSKVRGFVFVHDIVDGDERWEGATLSIGRVVEGAERHRDRFDLIVERRVVEGVSAGDIRVRAYVDPFRVPPESGWPRSHRRESGGVDGQALFAMLSDYFTRYRDEAERAWSHWTQDYIDYFGPRLEPVMGSAFPTALDEVRFPPEAPSSIRAVEEAASPAEAESAA